MMLSESTALLCIDLSVCSSNIALIKIPGFQLRSGDQTSKNFPADDSLPNAQLE